MEERTRPEKGRFKSAAITAVVLIVLGLAGYMWLSYRHAKEIVAIEADSAARQAELRANANDLATDLASDIAQVLSTTLSDDVARMEHAMLETQLATIVRGHRVTLVVVLSPTGGVLASTDQRFSGKTLDDPATQAALGVTEVTVMESPTVDAVEIASPLSVGSERVGTIRVFVDVTPFGSAGITENKEE